MLKYLKNILTYKILIIFINLYSEINTLMLSIYIDKKKFQVKRLDNLLQACLSSGQNIPYFCWHPVLGSIGSCRQCAIKLYTDSSCKIGTINMSCMIPVQENMHISILDKEVQSFRKMVSELMMVNHPHDCPVCSEGGNCHLQDMVVLNKHNIRRYHFKKRIYSNQFLGPFIRHEMNRCITCYRCVRYYVDYAGGNDFGVFGSNNKIYFGRLKDGYLNSEYSGNLLDVCPTGVFTEKSDIKPFYRKWDLQYTPSICHHCSIGCNISIGERFGSISRVDNRFHNEINKYFLCDLGRFGYGYSNLKNRPVKPYKKTQNKIKFMNYSQTIYFIHNLLINNKNNVFGIGSDRASIESNILLYKLVGKNNFSNGMNDSLNKCIQLMIKIIKTFNINIPTISEIETYDVILVISEDITQTASRAALAVRQAIKNGKYSEISKKNGIPIWNVNAIKNVLQDKKNILFVLGQDESKLDDISTWNYYGSVEEQILLSQKIVKFISSDLKITHKNDQYLYNKIYKISSALLLAKKPLIISGSSSRNTDIIKISANIALALKRKNKSVGILLFPPAANSFGISLISNISLEDAFNRIKKQHINTIIILENDLYRYFSKYFLNNFFKNIQNIIVLDHQKNQIQEKSSIFLSCTNSIESSGTIINYELRAQHFFKAYLPYFYNKDTLILESWRWLNAIKKGIFSLSFLQSYNLSNIISLCSKTISYFKDLFKIIPDIHYKIKGQKIARAPHRFSGRTALYAKYNIHEPTSPKDLDTIYSFSMEGAQLSKDITVPRPFIWSPGWNSMQSLFKYSTDDLNKKNFLLQGIYLYKKEISKNVSFFVVDKPLIPLKKKKLVFKVVPYYYLLSSEEMSQKYLKKYKYMNNISVVLNYKNAEILNIIPGEYISFDNDYFIFKLPLKISYKLNINCIGLPLGCSNIPFSLLGKKIINIKKDIFYYDELLSKF